MPMDCMHPFLGWLPARRAQKLTNISFVCFVITLCAWWSCANIDDFNTILKTFQDHWSVVCPQYANYFKNTWITRYKPVMWAK